MTLIILISRQISLKNIENLLIKIIISDNVCSIYNPNNSSNDQNDAIETNRTIPFVLLNFN